MEATYIKDKTFTPNVALEIYRQANAQTKYEAAKLAWGVVMTTKVRRMIQPTDYESLGVDELRGD